MAVSIVLQQPSAFDCKLKGNLYIFSFTVSGLEYTMNLKRLTIQDTSGVTKVQATESGNSPTFTLTDTMGASLANGSQYRAQIEVSTDNGSTWSVPSPWKSFLCYTTPIFNLTGFTTVINTSNYTLNTFYNQLEGELLNTYLYNIYNANGTLFASSGTLPTNSSTLPTTVSYTAQGLLNNTTYSVEVIGRTLGLGSANPDSGTLITINKTAFTVQYDTSIQTGQITLTNNCQAGNIVVELKPDTTIVPPLTDYESVKVKRREVNVNAQGVVVNGGDWLTMAQVSSGLVWTGKYSYIDKFASCGTYYQYAYVPIAYVTQQEGDYVLSDAIFSNFDGIYLSDRDSTFRFYSGLVYSNLESVQSVGVYEPLGSQYPKLVYNSAINYGKGGFEGNVIQDGYLTDSNRQINRVESTKKQQILLSFLKNKKSKTLKDWNGNNWLIGVIDNPNVIYDANYGMGFLKCSFNWVEKGSVMSQSDMDINNMTSLAKQSQITVNGPNGTYVELIPPSGNLEDALTGTIEEGEFVTQTYSTGTWTGNAYLAQGYTGGEQKTAGNRQTQTVYFEVIAEKDVEVDIISKTLTIFCNDEIVQHSHGSFILNQGTAYLTGDLNQNTQTFDVIQFGLWSGTAYGYEYLEFGASASEPQKQAISATVTTANQTIVVQPPAVLTITDTVSVPNYYCTYYIYNSKNMIETRSKTVKLFNDGTWTTRASLAHTNQAQFSSVTVAYGGAANWTVVSSTVTLSSNVFPYINNSSQVGVLKIVPDAYLLGNTITSSTKKVVFPVIKDLEFSYSVTARLVGSPVITQFNYNSTVSISKSYPVTIDLSENIPSYIWNCGATDASGMTLSNNVSAMLYADGNFIINGSGEMMLYHPQFNPVPWKNREYLLSITDVTINLNSLNYANYLFAGCDNLIRVRKMPSYIGSTNAMFSGAISLASVNNMPETIRYDASSMFAGCDMLTTLPNMPISLPNASRMFADCISLQTLPNMPDDLQYTDSMFYGCSSLTTIPKLPPSIIDASNMFYNCYTLQGRMIIQRVEDYLNMFTRDLKGSTLYLDYTSVASANIDAIVATKGSGAIYKGNLVPTP